MDQALSAVIIAVITGIFSVITLLIQRKQTKDISKIDHQANALKKEKKLKAEMSKAKEDLNSTINQIMILILDSNLDIMKQLNVADNQSISQNIFEAEQLKQQYNMILAQIKDINNKYQTLLELTQDLNSSSEDRRS